MMNRTLALFLTALREAARSPLAWLGTLALLLAVPLITFAFGEAGARVWLSRSLVSEGLRWLLPLAALMGAAYVIRPSLKRGWAALPARRGEYFFAASTASFVFTAVCAALLVASGAIAGAMLGEDARLDDVLTARTMQKHTGFSHIVTASADERLFARPNRPEQLVFDFDSAGLGESIEGKMQFEIAWTTEAAPSRTAPFDLKIIGDKEVTASTQVEARRRVTFSAPNPGGKAIRVIVTPNDPALSVGMKRDECRLVVARASAAPSLAYLGLIAVCGAFLCAGVSLAVRSLSTAPTAALAGALVFAALTLLPALAPGDLAARKRRADVENTRDDQRSNIQAIGDFLSLWVPPLDEPVNFERVLLGETARADDASAALWRLLAALACVPIGAALFNRRQIT